MKKLLLALIAAASPAAADVNTDAVMASRPPAHLSDFGFFDDLATMTPATGVTPYEIASALFTDYAEKQRWIYTPAPAPYSTEGALDFPVGAALIKLFHYGDNLIETRVLLHQEAGWKAYAYLWNADHTDADLKLAGADLAVDTPHGTISYHVPNVNQCKGCHVDNAGNFSPIGPKIRNLNVADQLQRFVTLGVLAEAPADAPAMPNYMDETVPLPERAAAYLDINCAHCHAPGHPADTSGLYLNWEEDRPVHRGIGKHPTAAGRGSGNLDYDVVPGDPDASIIVYRISSVDPGVMMPELGRTIVHAEGVQLIRDYIASLSE